MAKNDMNKVVEYLRRAVLLQDGAGQSDGKLLGCYIEEGDEAAFAALVRRHGPMVMSVSRRVLRNPHDAEDAFQATFLVLVRKAGSVVPREKVGNWLYGVANQTALRVQSLNAKRRGRERQVAVMPDNQAPTTADNGELQQVLDQELRRLPEKYRLVIVLCDLEGRTRQEVARHLGWPEGTVSGRLARGRAMLAKRLAKHGLLFSAEALAVALSAQAAAACLPPGLVSATAKAAGAMAAGQSAALSAKVVAITQGVMMSMLLTKLKTVAVVSLIVGVFGIGLGNNFLGGQTQGQGTASQAVGKNVDSAKAQTAGGSKPIEDGPKMADLLRRLETVEDQNNELKRKLAEHTAKIEMIHQQTPQKESKAIPSKPELPLEVNGYTLKNNDANEVVVALNDLFAKANNPKGTSLRFAVIGSSNTVLIRGTRDDIDECEKVITYLESAPRLKKKGPPPRNEKPEGDEKK